jgi:pyruvate formate lyase activating enzyme
MVIGGLQKFSVSDFPGRISAIVYTRGCNFRCPYCHNPELVDPARYPEPIPQSEVLGFLRSRTGRLGGVVVTGGEPTLHPDLPEFLSAIRSLGFDTKLDTNGSNPELLERVLTTRLVDYVALDIKAPLRGYRRVTGVDVSTGDIERSVRLVIESGLPHELRTTYEESLLSLEDLKEIARMARGSQRLILQSFRPTKTLDKDMLRQPTPDAACLDRARRAMEGPGILLQIR